MLFNILNIFYFILSFFISHVLSLFDMCNHNIEMKAGEKLYLNSPYYPADYPIGTSCRYVIKAPQDYELKFTCNIKLKMPFTATRCQNDIFYFNREGSEILTGSEYFCGTGKMERKSFLNQAVISYISTPFYKRIQQNVITETEEEIQKNKTNKTKETKLQEKIATTETKAEPTTVKTPPKLNQLTTLTTTTTSTTTTSTTPKPEPIQMHTNLLTTSLTQPLTSTTSLNREEHVNTNMEEMEEDKKVSNSFAYVLALLSNKIDIQVFNKKITTTTTKSPIEVTNTTSSSRPTSVLNFYDFLPTIMWRSGSVATHKISTKRVAKVIAGQDYTTTQSTTPSAPVLNFLNLFTLNSRSTAGGGSFSCLVEVLEPQCECGWGSTLKIAGPAGAAGINEFPSMTGILTIKNQKIFCGATIIHHRFLLSAAHCYETPETNRPEYLTAVVGEHDLTTVLDSFYTRKYDIEMIIPHEQFQASSNKVQNDIAILKTRFAIEWNRSVGPVCLPFHTPQDGGDATPYAGERVETAGWGTTSFGGQQSSVLLKTTLDVISRSDCENILTNLPFGTFCTYTPGHDTCQYDSGGALYARKERLYAVGIVSYGFACATNQPSVNTRISSHLQWIRSKTPEVKYCTK